jgi:sec-independent protein translocase protein TatA
MPGFIGLPEIILLGLVALLVFGPKRLPEMGRSLGRGLKEFKSSVSGDNREDDVLELHEVEPIPAPADTPEDPAAPAKRAA